MNKKKFFVLILMGLFVEQLIVTILRQNQILKQLS